MNPEKRSKYESTSLQIQDLEISMADFKAANEALLECNGVCKDCRNQELETQLNRLQIEKQENTFDLNLQLSLKAEIFGLKTTVNYIKVNLRYPN